MIIIVDTVFWTETKLTILNDFHLRSIENYKLCLKLKDTEKLHYFGLKSDCWFRQSEVGGQFAHRSLMFITLYLSKIKF